MNTELVSRRRFESTKLYRLSLCGRYLGPKFCVAGSFSNDDDDDDAECELII